MNKFEGLFQKQHSNDNCIVVIKKITAATDPDYTEVSLFNHWSQYRCFMYTVKSMCLVKCIVKPKANFDLFFSPVIVLFLFDYFCPSLKLFFFSCYIIFYFEIKIIFTISLTFRSFWLHYFTVVQTILYSAELLWFRLPNGSFVHRDNMTPTDPVICYKSSTEAVLFPCLFFFWLVKLNGKLSGHFNVKVWFFFAVILVEIQVMICPTSLRH